MPVGRHFRHGQRIAAQMEIGEDPVGLQRIAIKRQAKTMTHHAVGPIAANQPVGLDDLFKPAFVADGRRERGRHLRLHCRSVSRGPA